MTDLSTSTDSRPQLWEVGWLPGQPRSSSPRQICPSPRSAGFQGCRGATASTASAARRCPSRPGVEHRVGVPSCRQSMSVHLLDLRRPVGVDLLEPLSRFRLESPNDSIFSATRNDSEATRKTLRTSSWSRRMSAPPRPTITPSPIAACLRMISRGCREVDRGHLSQDPVEQATRLLVVVFDHLGPTFSWRATSSTILLSGYSSLSAWRPTVRRFRPRLRTRAIVMTGTAKLT